MDLLIQRKKKAVPGYGTAFLSKAGRQLPAVE